MGRRNFLLATVSAVSAGLAGCSALGGEEDAQGTYEPTAADDLAVAVGQLNKAALALEEFQDDGGTSSDEDRRRAFDASEPRERILTARDAISRAEEGGAEQADVRAVTQYADGVDGTVDAVANVTTASNRLASVEDSFGGGDDVDTDAAGATLAEATTASEASRTAHDDAEAALASADRDRLRAVDAQYDAVSSGLESLLGYIVGVDGLAVGYDTYVGGVDSLQTAQDQADTEAYDAARGSFSDAQTAFTDSASTFTGATDGAADDLQSDLTRGDERSRALDRLAAGYISLLDSRDHVSAAESAIEGGTEGDARSDLQAGSEDASAASSRFEDGAAVRDDEFVEEFRTAQNQATAMQSLSTGYGDVLDGRDRLEDGETAFVDEEYDRAGAAFGDADAAAARAETEFSAGDAADEDGLFDAEFEDAFRRASVLGSLGEGYELVVRGRQTAESARRELRAENFATAERQFRTAGDTFAEAETVFGNGQADAGDSYGPELDRALCRTGHLRNAMDHFVAAAQAGGDGDRRTLDAELNAGEADVDRVEEC